MKNDNKLNDEINIQIDWFKGLKIMGIKNRIAEMCIGISIAFAISLGAIALLLKVIAPHGLIIIH